MKKINRWVRLIPLVGIATLVFLFVASTQVFAAPTTEQIKMSSEAIQSMKDTAVYVKAKLGVAKGGILISGLNDKLMQINAIITMADQNFNNMQQPTISPTEVENLVNAIAALKDKVDKLKEEANNLKGENKLQTKSENSDEIPTGDDSFGDDVPVGQVPGVAGTTTVGGTITIQSSPQAVLTTAASP